MREKGGNRLVPGLDYMVDALKLSNQAPRVSGESLQTCVVCRCFDGTQHLFCWSILAVSGQSLASTGSAVDSRELNLVLGPTEATHKLFLSSPTKYTVESSWISLDQLTFRTALARQLIDGYSSKKKKERPASFQAKKCAVPDDVSFASMENHAKDRFHLHMI
ncbi:hypothetical protein TNCV_1012911 [Trichonephila clavipes]|uniref:Uncharacterized protein n=1 Tax=Trichonephila clavipes TaxID=2585209 RepID=A0A8X7BB39_TRICX|nr:hypothetical protein TNCV_1012911 [Trichonephila clavipes]